LKIVARHDLPSPVQQEVQDLKRLLGQPDSPPLFPKLARPDVELEHAEANDGLVGSVHKACWSIGVYLARRSDALSGERLTTLAENDEQDSAR
jgi:hypothetical protein